MTVSTHATLIAASLVLLLGNRLLAWIPLLRAWTIPEPVAGGLVVALVLFGLHSFAHFDVQFDTALQTPLMLAFFATIGLNAKLANLWQGGPMLVRFLAVVAGLLLLQNVVGIGLALAFGIDPLFGLLSGSVSLAGGHGTGAAWGYVFAVHHGLTSATEAAIACATFGLVMGGILGGPVAQHLMKRIGSGCAPGDASAHAPDAYAFEEPQTEQPTTPSAFIYTVTLIAISFAAGEAIADAIAGTSFELPMFVCVLFVAVLIANALAWAGKPVAAHAVVLTAGHCGFGLGATPTAIANMQAVTARFGHSHIAFLVVPLVAAFFIDIANAIVIKLTLMLPIFH